MNKGIIWITFSAAMLMRIWLGRDLDDLGCTLADGVQQRFLDALNADAVEQQFDGFHGLAVDGQVQRAAAHVVDAVDVERGVTGRRLAERLTNYGHVAQCRRVQIDSLLVRQLHAHETDTESLLGQHQFSLSLFLSLSLSVFTGADSTGATGNFVPLLTEEPEQTSRFAPIPFRGLFWFF